jgi:hypothetical protein
MYNFSAVIVCVEPEVPNGSFVTGYDFSVGSEIQYHCEEGHVMLGGTEIRRCTLKGTWSGIAPQCRCEFKFEILSYFIF